MKRNETTTDKILMRVVGGSELFWWIGWAFVWTLLCATSWAEDAEAQARIRETVAELEVEIDQLESEIDLVRRDLLLKQQTLAQLEGYVEEIDEAYPPPRSEEVEKGRWEFDRMREAAQQDVSYHSEHAKELEIEYAALMEGLNELNRELIKADFEPLALRIGDIEIEEEAELTGSDDALDMLNSIIIDARKDLEVLTDEVYVSADDTKTFIAKAEKIRIESLKKSDIIYEQMHARYLYMKSRGVRFIGPPLKPIGYDERASLRKAGVQVANQISPSRTPPVVNTQQPGQKPLSEVEQLRLAIANTTDPQQKANLEEQLKVMEGAQN